MQPAQMLVAEPRVDLDECVVAPEALPTPRQDPLECAARLALVWRRRLKRGGRLGDRPFGDRLDQILTGGKVDIDRGP